MADYFVSPTATSGSGSFGDPWTLAQMVAAAISASDRVFLIAGAYTLAGTSGITLTDNANCQFVAIAANGDFDPDARATIDAVAVTSGPAITISHNKTHLFGIVVNNCGGSSGIQVTATDCSFVACEANNSDTNGFNVSGAGTKFAYCKAEDNTGDGFSIAANADCAFIHCAAIDNGSDGFACSPGATRAVYSHCVGRGNTAGKGFQIDGECLMVNCTAFDNGDDGIECISDHNTLVKVASWSNGGFGIDYDGATSPQRDLVITPFIGTGADANTSGPFDADDGGTDTGVWDYTGIVPSNLGGDGATQAGVTFGPVGGLATVASGTDLTPLVGSPLIDAGIDLPYLARGDRTSDIGAIESAGNAAAGGALNPTIMGVM